MRSTRMEGRGDWSRLVVRPDVAAELLALEARCCHVQPGEWELWRGRGVRALFSGPPGNGKTLAADILATRLGRTLYRIDLSAAVSKYIGETEKNLERLFAGAAPNEVVLFFDEADALFGSRMDVRDAHDRYANQETSDLLQRIEDSQGIVILATNIRQSIDSAFTRRFDVIIDFPFPDAAEREQIWRRHLPAGQAVDDVWLGQVARCCLMSGAQIRNAVIAAALRTASRGEGVVHQSLLVEAIQAEYRKLGIACPLD